MRMISILYIVAVLLHVRIVLMKPSVSPAWKMQTLIPAHKHAAVLPGGLAERAPCTLVLAMVSVIDALDPLLLIALDVLMVQEERKEVIVNACQVGILLTLRKIIHAS